MKIISCTENDVKEVYELICDLKDTEFNFAKFKNAFNSKLKDDKNYYILCVEDKQIVGFLSLYIDYQLHHAQKVATIEELVVNNKKRSGGIGKALVDAAIKQAKEKECEIIELTSGFDRDRAHQFYDKNGFEKSSYKFIKNL
jgi:PhnO protein